MTRNEAVFILEQFARACDENFGCESEKEAFRMAIYDMGIVAQMKKERDAALCIVNDLMKPQGEQ